MTKVGLYAIGTSTTLESNKSLGSLRQNRKYGGGERHTLQRRATRAEKEDLCVSLSGI
jgi:hypothetical protein